MKRIKKHEYNGKQFDSNAELTFGKWLEECTGQPVSDFREVSKLKYRVPERERGYFPDFSFGSLHFEYKGRLLKQDRDKLIWARDSNPGTTIVIVFQRAANKIRKGSPTSYGDWATKNGFIWFDSTIPKNHLLKLIKEHGKHE